MTLEINEIRIRMRVGDEPAQRQEKSSEGDDCGDSDRAQIVEDCTRRVLRLLENRRQR